MNKINEKVDIVVLELLTFLFIIIGLVMMNVNTNTRFSVFIMFGVLFLIIMITYLTNIMVGLIIASITIFIYASYILYKNIVQGIEVELISYLWLVAIPIGTILTGYMSKFINELQTTNIRLKEEYKELVTIDSITGLRNLKIFYHDVNNEISKANRYKNTFTLMVIKLPYFKELKKILGRARFHEVIKIISNIIIECTRIEDVRYSLDEHAIGIVMPNTNIDGAKVVKERIKKQILGLNLRLSNEGNLVNIDLKIGCLEYKESIKDSIELKNLAEEELQYDV